jgi:alkylation response protein AidB-like acyl-CoA dehydrogenase
MEFKFSPEEITLRDAIRSFLDAELPADWDWDIHEVYSDDELWSFARAFLKKLAARGWSAPAWPPEYGGAGYGVLQQLIYSEEMAYRYAPLVNASAITMLGPVLQAFGSAAQKREHLARIISTDVIWCQGYSEPSAGSDLASLQTTAVKDGDDFLITGQKIWTSFAHRSEWMFLLARTDKEAPRHKGLGFFLMDMASSGVKVEPLLTMNGAHYFNQVFLDDVRVPRENLIGGETDGWLVAATLLDFERSNIAAAARARRDLDDLIQFLREAGPRVPSTLALAELAVEIEIGRLLSYRVASMQGRGEIPNAEASAAKLYHSELAQRLSNAALNILARTDLPNGDGAAPRFQRRTARMYTASMASTIAGGTSEIQRNIIAYRGLGLPR